MAGLDGRWAILSDPAKKGGRWDTEEFLETGRLEIEAVLERGRTFGFPVGREAALDFGCGVGRLTRAMADAFSSALGVDISAVMVSEAQRLNKDTPACSFEVLGEAGMTAFRGRMFDFIYSRLVLQHIHDGRAAEAAIRGLADLVGVGGLLVFQVPNRLPFRRRLQLRPRLYHFLRGLRVPPSFLYRQLGLHPIRMNAVPEETVTRLLREAGTTILEVSGTEADRTSIDDRTYWVTRSR